MQNKDIFAEKKYVYVENVLSPEMVKIVSTYTLLDEKNDFSLEEGDRPQIHNSHSQYADTLMESLLLYVHPIMEENTGLKLFPTYSYYRVYRPGANLVKHVDRPSCEISATLTLEFDYKGADYDYPIFMGDGAKCSMKSGDMIVYRGCEVEHWREIFAAPDGSYHSQVFFHFVDANGPYAEYKFDRRPYIGFDKEGSLTKNISRFFFPKKNYVWFTG